MIDKSCLKIMNSKCKQDYKFRHYWVSHGVIMIASYIYTIWQCTQCSLCVREKLTFHTGGIKKAEVIEK